LDCGWFRLLGSLAPCAPCPGLAIGSDLLYNEFMYSKEDIAKKMAEFLMKKSSKNLRRHSKIPGLLKFLKREELKAFPRAKVNCTMNGSSGLSCQ
jgi:hypothetical protein